ncbi:N-acetyltransferase [Ignavigranum ruoffiae]|uniref:GNAT family N-acetyltransferase n=1 Tax=Ignavigranum ruoffiae TaxID=89093 RepID=UPI0020652A14|nr:N-acetyltransferase [Ignavigranum ruoffiae]UPQ85069.1 N-acetyltransferase [Ignavigranum ruoffiae]
MDIRMAKIKDLAKIKELIGLAFAGVEYSDGQEAELVYKLFKSSAYIPELTLVAEIGGKIVGFIMFSRAYVGQVTVLALAPLAVLPEFQNQGTGSLLVRQGHQIARKLSFPYSIVLGDPAYYQRFDYLPADQFGIDSPFDVATEYFMASKLDPAAMTLSGTMRYDPAFKIEE